MGRGDTQPTLAEKRAAGPRNRLWSDFSYVASSSYRERVLRSLAERPQLPKQLAQNTDLRLVHVSRALRELSDRNLVECLTPETKSRGRLYGILPSGSALVAFFRTSTHRYLPYTHGHPAIGFVPKIRGTLAVRCLAFLRATKGDAATRAALRDWSVALDEVTEGMWLPVDAYDEFFELLEASFGDGGYDFIRKMSTRAVPSMSAVKEQVLKAIPLEALAERAPIVYSKEWNYGRLEVEAGRGWARFLHYDWEPTPPMCALLQGTYEGVLAARGMQGIVKKTHCVRLGDDRCEYLAEWWTAERKGEGRGSEASAAKGHPRGRAT